MTEHAPGLPASPVLNVIRHCRRRLRLVAAVRYAGVTVPAAIVLVEAVALLAHPLFTTLVLTAVLAVGLALVCAVTASAVRTPSLRDTAIALDHRLLLKDCLVTALQVADDDDPMARLVVQDAARRLDGVSADSAFPLQAPPRFRAIVAGAVAMSLLMLLTIVLRSPERNIGRDGNSSAAAAQENRPAQRPPNQTDSRLASEPVPVDGVPKKATSNSGAQPMPAATADRATPRDVGQTPAGLRASGSRGETSGAAPLPSSGGATTAGTARGDGRGAAAESAHVTAAAGGVNAGPLRDARTPVANGVPLTDPHTNPGYAARYRAASAQAQTAIVQERVPPALRAYVKAYFVAIRP